MKTDTAARQERLRLIAASLHIVYSEGPLLQSAVFASQIRRMHEAARQEEAGALPTVRQMCAGVKPDHDVEYIVVCPTCGQMFDCRDRLQLDHHSRERHEPLLH